MKQAIGLIRNQPVLTYFALVFLISWSGVFLILGPGGFPLRAEEFERLGALLFLAIFAGPSVAGILLTGVVDGKLGLREVLLRLRRWRAGWRWYAFALLPAVVMAATALLLSLVSSDFRPAIIDSNTRGGILMGALGSGLIAGVFEEIGWTGFAVPHLRSRHSIFATGVAVGIVWGAWHFPLFWQRDSFSATLPLAVLLTSLFSWLPAFRVLLVWVHERTQSLPVVMFMHGTVSFMSLALFAPAATGASLLTGLPRKGGDDVVPRCDSRLRWSPADGAATTDEAGCVTCA